MKMHTNWPLTGRLSILILLALLFAAGFQCSPTTDAYLVGGKADPEYDLTSPEHIYELPPILEEVSGLSFYVQDKNVLACIQDEDGKLFLYHMQKEQLISEEKFAGDDDYEGVEIVGERVFVVNSSGDIFSFTANNTDAEKWNTPLNRKYDVEGLGFRRDDEHLILACKENPENDEKALFFSFSIKSYTLGKNPVFVIDHREVKAMLEEKNYSKKKHLPFKPSGVAIHPLDQRIFVVASVGKLLLVLSANGELIDVVPLPPKLFAQPEGICFDAKCNLYIANEGKKTEAKVLRFKNMK